MDSPDDRRARLRKLGAQAGVAASAFAVFTAGWVAMKADDWRHVVLYTALAGVAGLVAQAFSRRAR